MAIDWLGLYERALNRGDDNYQQHVNRQFEADLARNQIGANILNNVLRQQHESREGFANRTLQKQLSDRSADLTEQQMRQQYLRDISGYDFEISKLNQAEQASANRFNVQQENTARLTEAERALAAQQAAKQRDTDSNAVGALFNSLLSNVKQGLNPLINLVNIQEEFGIKPEQSKSWIGRTVDSLLPGETPQGISHEEAVLTANRQKIKEILDSFNTVGTASSDYAGMQRLLDALEDFNVDINDHFVFEDGIPEYRHNPHYDLSPDASRFLNQWPLLLNSLSKEIGQLQNMALPVTAQNFNQVGFAHRGNTNIPQITIEGIQEGSSFPTASYPSSIPTIKPYVPTQYVPTQFQYTNPYESEFEKNFNDTRAIINRSFTPSPQTQTEQAQSGYGSQPLNQIDLSRIDLENLFGTR